MLFLTSALFVSGAIAMCTDYFLNVEARNQITQQALLNGDLVSGFSFFNFLGR